MEIKVTRDYSLFKKLDGNRDVKKKNALVNFIPQRYKTVLNYSNV